MGDGEHQVRHRGDLLNRKRNRVCRQGQTSPPLSLHPPRNFCGPNVRELSGSRGDALGLGTLVPRKVEHPSGKVTIRSEERKHPGVVGPKKERVEVVKGSNEWTGDTPSPSPTRHRTTPFSHVSPVVSCSTRKEDTVTTGYTDTRADKRKRLKPKGRNLTFTK